ncbi:hypothetical protein T4C_5129, partial [Trichinella pseudospiralis]
MKLFYYFRKISNEIMRIIFSATAFCKQLHSLCKTTHYGNKINDGSTPCRTPTTRGAFEALCVNFWEHTLTKSKIELNKQKAEQEMPPINSSSG